MIAGDHGLVVVSMPRDDGTIASSVVNAGVVPHPVTGATVVGMVIRGGTRKLDRLRMRPYANVVARSGWQWAAAEGRVELAGPWTRCPASTPSACGSCCGRSSRPRAAPTRTSMTYDRVMLAEGRTAVLVYPERVYSNPGQ